MQEIYIARQPIIDHSGHVHGYELLFRHSFDNQATPIHCNTHATSKVLTNALTHFGTKKLLGNHYGFINIDHTFFETSLVEAIPAEGFVLEILEDTVVSDEFISKVKNFSQSGYRFALDDMDLSDEMIRRFEPIFKYLTYVKIDLFSVTKETINEKIELFAPYTDIKLLAEKVETVEDYDYYKNLGFSYFQGYFYEKPTVFHQKNVNPSQQILLDIISMIDADHEINAIETKFLHCPHLIMSLLKYINSVAFGVKAPITSIAHAMSLLGRKPLKQWMMLFLYAESTGERFSEPILLSALFRAKMMNLIAEKIAPDKKEKAFMTGLLSLFHVISGHAADELIASFHLDPLISSALIDRTGILGTMLEVVSVMDDESFLNLEEHLAKLGISEDELHEITMVSHNWTNEFYLEHFEHFMTDHRPKCPHHSKSIIQTNA